jgi:putative mRNA 3-end processing factor
MLKDAGHIPGSAITQIETDGKRIVYTGDFKLEETLLHKGAEMVEDVDILLIESTYSEREHPARKKLEEELYKETIRVLENGGNALLPSFAVGRSQELVQILRHFDENVKIYLDGMAKTASQIIMDYPSYVKDAKALTAALESVEWVNSDGQRKRALERPSIIVTTAGLVEGGPVLRYILKLNKNSEIIFTGFQIPGTNGRRILDEHKMKFNGVEHNIQTPARYMDFSAHAGRKDLFGFVKKANPEKIFCIHGDTCIEFANELNSEGYDAVAPKMGDSFSW